MERGYYKYGIEFLKCKWYTAYVTAYINRVSEKNIRRLLKTFPVVAVTGPRQSGKTTLLKHMLGNYSYVTFDDPLNVSFFNEDPKGFLSQYTGKVIYDEVQRVPQLLHYIKMSVDEHRAYGKYVLTGSNQFGLVKEMSETLAGRIGHVSLYPLQQNEIPKQLRRYQLLQGSYPELINLKYQNYINWYASYYKTYLERDVYSAVQQGSRRDFQKFVQLLAAATSQELNMSRFATDIGVDTKTIQRWVSILESSYIIFTLQPYYKNYRKRIVKRPKVYFVDTGMVCYLTGIRDQLALEKGPMWGSVFENYIVAEIQKNNMHLGLDNALYYFRDNSGKEVDLIIEAPSQGELTFCEIKANATLKTSFTHNVNDLIKLEKQSESPVFKKIQGMVLYRGSEHKVINDVICQNIRHYLEN